MSTLKPQSSNSDNYNNLNLMITNPNGHLSNHINCNKFTNFLRYQPKSKPHFQFQPINIQPRQNMSPQKFAAMNKYSNLYKTCENPLDKYLLNSKQECYDPTVS